MSHSDELQNLVNFLFEVGVLAKTPRSGFHFLGSGEQSVAEHINRVSYIGLVLAKLEPRADELKVLKMCLMHDLPEARTSDLNYVHQKYAEAKPMKAVDDLDKSLPFGGEIKELIEEYEERKVLEAQLAKDADQLEWMMALKEQYDIGNERAKDWMEIAQKRLKTEAARRLSDVVLDTDSNAWWFSDKNDKWWVSRNKE